MTYQICCYIFNFYSKYYTYVANDFLFELYCILFKKITLKIFQILEDNK